MEARTVTNLPVVAIWIVALAQIVFALAMAVVALALLALLGQIKQLLRDAGQMTGELNRKMPGLLDSVDATLGNVKGMSDDARSTTHHVTNAVNRVSHVAHAVAGRLESPLVKSVGVLTGVAAGVRALRGSRKEREVVIERREKKRRGLLGLRKK